MSDIPPRDPLEALACCLVSNETLVSLVDDLQQSINREGFSDDAYEAAIDNAYELARSEERYRQREEKRKEKILAFLEAEGAEGLLRSRRRLTGLAAYKALLERCQAVRYSDPTEMVNLARCAAALAEKLDASRYGREQVIDFRCRAWVELGNAHRVADQLAEAEQALARAAQLFLEGTGDDLLEARMYDIQATFFNTCRRFKEALEALDTVEAIYRRRGDLHLAGRTLVSKGMYIGYSGDPERAIGLISEGLTLLNRRQDPQLVFAAIHNISRLLRDCGKHRDARAFLFAIRGENEEDAGGPVNLLKVRWLEAQISMGLEELDRAERDLLYVVEGFERANLPYKAALAALELALVYLEQDRYAEARATAIKALDRFVVLKIPEESLMSVLVLRRAFERGKAEGGALLRVVIEFLKRAEDDPTIRFDDWIG